MKVPADRLRSVLGVTSVHSVPGKHSLAIVDTPLAEVVPELASIKRVGVLGSRL